MSLQRIDVKAEPAFIPSGFMNNLSELIKADEDVLIRDAPRLVPDDVLERPIPDTLRPLRPLRTGRVDSEKWCGDERTKYAVVKHIVYSCSYLRGACPRVCERNVPGRMGTHRSLTANGEVWRTKTLIAFGAPLS